ncbi:hypothetical protein AB0C18_09550 [Nonomuraea muscovyensis]|uniref:hypothetical protein n=1 Tax=Nonomuraea muscovyensis TaxID=1124761 RepID=UPI0033DBA5EA
MPGHRLARLYGGNRAHLRGTLIEIACDESGSEGEKLIGGNTAVFAHAGVHLSHAAAANGIERVRARAPSPTTEYKSGIIRRSKHREALKWMLGPAGPLLGNAHVLLIDKALFATGRLAGLLAAGPDLAGFLHREGPRAFGPQRWEAFLAAYTDLLRGRNGRAPATDPGPAFHLLDALLLAAPPGRLHDALGGLQRARAEVEALRERQLAGDRPPALPSLDPLIPAIAGAVAHWGAGGGPVTIVHDRQTLLTDERIAGLKELLGASLAGLRLVDSRTDPRVQVADLLAGAARKIAEDELHGRGDPELTALLRPYVTPASIWAPAG